MARERRARAPFWLHRLLLSLAPPRFRARFASDLLQVYEQTLERAAASGSRSEVWWVRSTFVLDLVGTVLLEWAYVLTDGLAGAARACDGARDHVGLALRGFWQRPGFTFVLVATFALGVGANVSVFQVFDALLLAPLPYQHPDRLVAVWHRLPGRDKAKVGPATYLDWREHAETIEALALLQPVSMAVTGEGDPVRVNGAEVSGNFFDVLGAEPLLGRPFRLADEVPGAKAVVILSHGLWARRYGAEPSVLGRTLDIQGAATEIVGVMPKGFTVDYGGVQEMWRVMTFGDEERQLRGTFHYLLGRLRPGATPGDAEGELVSIFERVLSGGDQGQAGWGARVVPLKDEIVGEVRPTLLLLMGAVGLVLLIGCANIANLTLARTSARGHELALRLALGARRWRIVRQIVVESLVLAVVGGALGLGIASLGTRALLASAPPGLPRLHEVGLDARAFSFALALTITTGLLTGLMPALRHGGRGASLVLRDGSTKVTDGRSSSRLLRLFLVSESALVTVLLIGAGLLLQSFHHLTRVDPGFDAGPGLVVGLDFPPSRYGDEPAVRAFTRELGERLTATPGVAAVGITTHIPTRGGFQLFYEAEGHPIADPSERKLARFEAVSPGHLETLGVRLKRGRLFDATDSEDGAPALVVNETMADLLWPSEDAIGKEIRLGQTSWRVVGVIADVRHQGLHVEPEPQFYMVDEQMGFRWSTRDVLLRPASGDPASLVPAVRSVLRELDPLLPTAYVAPMSDVMEEAVAGPRFRVWLLSILAAVALLLGAVGVYGVVHYTAGRRAREIAIRRSLGAGTYDVLSLVMLASLLPVSVGVLVGLGVATAVTPRFSDLLFRVDAYNAMTFGATGVFIVMVGVAASLPVALRVLRARPAEILATE